MMLFIQAGRIDALTEQMKNVRLVALLALFGCFHVEQVSAAPAPTMVVDATPSTVYPGQAFTFSWSSTNASYCVGASGRIREANGVMPGLSASKKQRFEMTCHGPGGSVTASKVVNVVPNTPDFIEWGVRRNPGDPLVSQITVAPGTAISLRWNVLNADYCFGTNGKERLVADEVVGFTVTKNTRHIVTCHNAAGGVASRVVDISVTGSESAPTVIHYLNSDFVSPGGSLTRSWAASNGASSCIILPGGAQIPSDPGSISTPAITKDTTFGLQCFTPGGASNAQHVTAKIIRPSSTVVGVSPKLITIAEGQSTTINWSSSNEATLCWGNEDVPLASTRGVFNTGVLTATKTFSFSCENLGGRYFEHATVLVVSTPAAPILSNVERTTSSPPVDTDGGFTVNWAVSGGNPNRYELYENGEQIYSGPDLSKVITGKSGGVLNYTLKACSGTICSSPSQITAVSVVLPPSVPAKFLIGGNERVNINDPAVLIDDDGSYALSWDAVPGVSYYEIEQNGQLVEKPNHPTASVSYSGKPPGDNDYRVRACHVGGICSSWSAVASIDRALPAPTGLKIIDANKSENPAVDHDGVYSFQWSPVSGARNYYLFQNSGASGSEYWSSMTNSRALPSTRPNGRYTYSVKACLTRSCSPNSEALQVDVYPEGQSEQSNWSQWLNVGVCRGGKQTQVRVCQAVGTACVGDSIQVISCSILDANCPVQ